MIDLDELERKAKVATQNSDDVDTNSEFIAAFNPSVAKELIRRLRETEHRASTSRQEALEDAVSIVENIALHSEPDDFALDALNEAIDKIRMIE